MAYYEKQWDCSSCGEEHISALRKLKCPKCGDTKSPQAKEYETDNVILDFDGIALAEGGPHWTCSSCGTVCLDKYQACTSCGNERDVTDQTNRIIVLGSEPPPQAPAPVRSDEPAYAPLARYSHYQFERAPYQSPRSLLKVVGIVTVSLVLLAVLGYAIFHQTPVPAEVTGFTWTRSVSIEQYQTVHESGWSSPSGAYNISSDRRIVRYEPVFETIIVTEHHPKTCRSDMGNGAVKVEDCSYDDQHEKEVKVGDDPIYDDWYEYDLDTWRYARTVESKGTDRLPFWPQYALALEGRTAIGAERVASRYDTYWVIFTPVNDGDDRTFRISVDQASWLAYQVGISYPLGINSFGIIVNDPLQDRLKE